MALLTKDPKNSWKALDEVIGRQMLEMARFEPPQFFREQLEPLRLKPVDVHAAPEPIRLGKVREPFINRPDIRGYDLGAERCEAVKPVEPRLLKGGIQDIFAMERYDTSKRSEHQKVAEPLKTYMKRQGWNYVGCGHFSLVFSDGKRALKVCGNRRDAGLTYAAWCRSNQHLPHVPRIDEVFGEQSFYCVVMELLEPMPDAWKHPEYDQAKQGLRDGYYGSSYASRQGNPAYDVAHRIGGFFMGIAECDLHSDNVMRRPGTGELIITDPVCFQINTGD